MAADEGEPVGIPDDVGVALEGAGDVVADGEAVGEVLAGGVLGDGVVGVGLEPCRHEQGRRADRCANESGQQHR